MAGRLGRTFSFDDNDETSLHGQVQKHDYGNAPSPSPYTDSPTRERRYEPPPAPVHRPNPSSSYQLPQINTRQQPLGHSTSTRTASTITPGADNLGESAVGGGISGVALGVANTHQRESGLEAVREADRFQNSRGLPQERGYDMVGSDTPYIPDPPSNPNRLSHPRPPSSHQMSQPRDPFASPAPSRRSDPFDDNNGSPTASRGSQTPRGYQPTTSIPMSAYPPQDAFANNRSYSDNPYNRYSSAWDARVSRADIDPNEIADDGDEMTGPEVSRRRSTLGFNNRSQDGLSEATAVGGATGVLGSLGGLVGRNGTSGSGNRDASGHYGPVGGPPIDLSDAEKSEWLNSQTSGRKRLRWFVGILVALIIIGAAVGGTVAGIKRSRSSESSRSSQGQSAVDDSSSNGDLDKDSPEIKKLLNNPELHKVFPGMDYTPFNAQYPECLSNMPSQNNVTRDVAVLSQLTNAIRLYGTDCNQTEMVLHAIDRLAVKDVKLWLGVWLDGNQTTNDRGIEEMNSLISRYGAEPFAGVIIGNEVLYREELDITEIGKILSDTKTNFTAHNIDLPVATSDLGDDWTPELAATTDIVMSNVHPFFAGVSVDTAASWTWNFWKTKDLILTEGTTKKNLISEVGWPSGGGKNCGQATSCEPGSVASIDNLNKFMDSFVCQSLANSTDFFWFEAFDEPWKKKLYEPGKEWEDKWGLMDSGRKLKPGLKIPDCGGKTVA